MRLLIVPLLLPFLPIDDPKPVKPVFTMDRKTTFITEPLTADGYPDYETVLNTKLRGDLKPGENACVVLWQVVGPRPEGDRDLPAEYWKWLGAPAPSADGSYHRSRYDFEKAAWQKANPKADLAEFQAARDKRDDLVGEMRKRPWTAKDDPMVADWLADEAGRLALVSEGVKRKGYFNPLIPRTKDGKPEMLIGTLLPHVQKCRSLADALSMRVSFHLGNKDQDAAWQDVLTLHRLGRQMQHGGTLIEFLVGIAIESIGQGSAVTYLNHATHSDQEWSKRVADLGKLPAGSSTTHKVDLAERFTMLDSAVWMRKHGMQVLEGISGDGTVNLKEKTPTDKAMEGMDWSAMLAVLTASSDRLISISKLPTHLEQQKAWAVYETELKAMKKEAEAAQPKLQAAINDGKLGAFVGESVGKILVSLLTPAVMKVAVAETRCRQQHSNVAIAIALEAYRAKEKRYPESLDALSMHFKEIAPDQFTGKPLYYERTADGYLLASAGMNGTLEKKLLSDPPEDGQVRGDDLGVRMTRK